MLRYHKTGGGQAEVGETNRFPVELGNAGLGSADEPMVVEVPAPATFYHGQTVVTTAGTEVVLGSAQAIHHVTVKALAGNTGLIYVGKSAVSSTDGFELSAGEAMLIVTDNVADVYIDASADNQGVSWQGS